MVLGDLEQPAGAASFLRDLRTGRLDTRMHPAQPVVTLGAFDQLATLRAYQGVD